MTPVQCVPGFFFPGPWPFHFHFFLFYFLPKIFVQYNFGLGLFTVQLQPRHFQTSLNTNMNQVTTVLQKLLRPHIRILYRSKQISITSVFYTGPSKSQNVVFMHTAAEILQNSKKTSVTSTQGLLLLLLILLGVLLLLQQQQQQVKNSSSLRSRTAAV
jgi:hypothetical protein